MKSAEIKKIVRKGYGEIAKGKSCCCGPKISCCGDNLAETISRNIGYKDEDLKAVPDGANLGLGCGNPVALASLKKGETVLDLGSGAGFDCFLAANRVGKNGRVIGIDMTPEMVKKAKANAKKSGYENVEFRLGEIEKLPVEDNSIDIIISNCVINLSPEKHKVFKETFRVLRSGGRLMVSDIVLLEELPDFIKNSVSAYIGCLSGALMKDEYIETIKKAGFKDIKIISETHFPIEDVANDPIVQVIINKADLSADKFKEAANSVVSVKVSASK